MIFDYDNLSLIVRNRLFALREEKKFLGYSIDYLSDDAINKFCFNMMFFLNEHYNFHFEVETDFKFLSGLFNEFYKSLAIILPVERIGLEKEFLLGTKKRFISLAEAKNYVSELNYISSQGSFSLDGTDKIGVIEIKNDDQHYHKSFGSAFLELLSAENLLFSYLPSHIRPIPLNKQKSWASDIHIHYGFPSFDQRLDKLLGVRDILPELVIMTAENKSFLTRSYRLKKRFNNWLIYKKPNSIFDYFALTFKSISSFFDCNLLRFSSFGSLEIRVFDAKPFLESQRDVLFAVNDIIHAVSPPENDDNCLIKRWKYAMGVGKKYLQRFPYRKKIVQELFDNVSKLPEEFPERFGL